MNWVLVGVFAYILLQLIVGVAVSRRVRSESDYLIAGRNLGLGLATFSMFATWVGGWGCPYLISVLAALGAFVSVGLAESRGARIPCDQ